jgi:hypothetical protein
VEPGTTGRLAPSCWPGWVVGVGNELILGYLYRSGLVPRGMVWVPRTRFRSRRPPTCGDPAPVRQHGSHGDDLIYWALRRLLELIAARGRRDSANELELLVLRHELTVLRRQVAPRTVPTGGPSVCWRRSVGSPEERWPALLVRHETIRRWHRETVARRWTYQQRSSGHPSIDRTVRELIVRLARENPTWGYRRVQGELNQLGIEVAPSTAWRCWFERAWRGSRRRADPPSSWTLRVPKPSMRLRSGPPSRRPQ